MINMNMNLRHIVAAAVLAATSGASFAQTSPAPAPSPDPVAEPVANSAANTQGTRTPLIKKHEANQQDRIQQGRESGELTRRESRRLRAEQKAIDHAENKAAADGTVTAQERQRIRHMQNRAGKDIRRQKHDAASAPAAGQ